MRLETSMPEVLSRLMPAGVMTPGTYLNKRRMAAGLEPLELARHMAGMPWPIGEPSPAQIRHFIGYLHRLELDHATLTRAQFEVLREALPIDVTVYYDLVALRDDGPDSELSQPNVCRVCGCSHFNACVDQAGRPCAWTSVENNLCTACALTDWPDAPLPEGVAA